MSVILITVHSLKVAQVDEHDLKCLWNLECFKNFIENEKIIFKALSCCNICLFEWHQKVSRALGQEDKC